MVDSQLDICRSAVDMYVYDCLKCLLHTLLLLFNGIIISSDLVQPLLQKAFVFPREKME